MSFIKENYLTFNVEPTELKISNVFEEDEFWYVNIDRFYKGIKVEGAGFYIRISQGNIISFYTTKYSDIKIDTNASYTTLQAGRNLFNYIEGIQGNEKIIEEKMALVKNFVSDIIFLQKILD